MASGMGILLYASVSYHIIFFTMSYQLFSSLQIAVECPSLVRPPNGSLILSGKSFEDIAVYTCDTGFVLAGESHLVCGSNGLWSGIPPSCQFK